MSQRDAASVAVPLFIHPSAFIFHPLHIPQLPQQFLQLIRTAMHIANDVEWTMFVAAVIPQRDTLDGSGFDFGQAV